MLRTTWAALLGAALTVSTVPPLYANTTNMPDDETISCLDQSLRYADLSGHAMTMQANGDTQIVIPISDSYFATVDIVYTRNTSDFANNAMILEVEAKINYDGDMDYKPDFTHKRSLSIYYSEDSLRGVFARHYSALWDGQGIQNIIPGPPTSIEHEGDIQQWLEDTTDLIALTFGMCRTGHAPDNIASAEFPQLPEIPSALIVPNQDDMNNDDLQHRDL